MSVFGSVVSVILCPILILLGDATVPLAGTNYNCEHWFISLFNLLLFRNDFLFKFNILIDENSGRIRDRINWGFTFIHKTLCI